MDKERRGGGMGGVGVKGIILVMGVRGGAAAASAAAEAAAAASERERERERERHGKRKKKVWTNVGQNALPAGKPHKMMFSRSLC